MALASLLPRSSLVWSFLRFLFAVCWPNLSTSLLQQKTNNLGSSHSRQNCSFSMHIYGQLTHHQSTFTTTVNLPKKWEQPELKLPCNLKLLLLSWVHLMMMLLNLCSAWLSHSEWLGFLMSALMTMLSFSIFSLLFNFIGSTSGLTKYLIPAPVPPSTFDSRSVIHGYGIDLGRSVRTCKCLEGAYYW